jgi:UDP-N-acetylglucosamine acyltransferase
VTFIHPTAIVDSTAELADSVEVGPYCIIGPSVVIGDGCKLESHVVIKGPVTVGANNHFYQFCSIGEACQDKKYKGEPTQLVIGERNVFREFVTVHRGTVQDQGLTQIGNDNWIMAYVHIAHDCVVGNDTVFSNGSTLAGHVRVGDGVILSGFTGIHQHCQIGAFSMTGMRATIAMDVPAFVLVGGAPVATRGLNLEGMKRRGYSASLIQILKNAYKTVYRQGLGLQDAIVQLESLTEKPPELLLFIESLKHSKRGIVR